MLEKIIALDTELLIFLNGLGSESYDSLWLIITKQINWIPLFLLFLYLIFKKIGAKQTLYLILFIALLLTFTDQVTNLFKNGFQRLRPCSNPEINTIIRVVKSSSSYSFFSGHAANSMAVAVFLYSLLKRYYKFAFLLFLWPLIFAYSRIYLGLHYPLDILCGYLFGTFSGFMFFKIYQAVQKKYFPQ
ncbi:phosphatase PAP2 family protein [Flavobacterium granuli]|uniref:Undecaprenyl-diphosphatase n=1 Tax=Flavobacterium granuli TaxID=280093 RepID=A0A1M5MZN4_9FLAO|nr:phosphatase PAP2 family protein [Flavobacterium granuli]PRZ25124.1 undecaprenyl-diphosphatase [Flavobacterium granuli]SHG82213.1 undecaprenyl-diphosphatase [Flavobacterium granuli]